ncbi:MAG TPA: hotdog domain-containing protein [Acidimicrobiales bacterium]
MPSARSGPPAPVDEVPRPGIAAGVALEVGAADTADALGSGDVPVLATPRLIALCEEASCRALDGHVAEGRTSVATRVRFDHLAPVAIGATVTAEATLVRVEGRRLTFALSATLRSDACADVVGAGRLTRVLVDRSAFLAKAQLSRGAKASGGRQDPTAAPAS